MPTTVKEAVVQGTASTGTYATLHSTGAGVTAICQVMIAIEAASEVTVRLGLADSAGTPTRWRLYDVKIAPNDTMSVGPINMKASRFMRISSSANTCTFSADIVEQS